MARPVDPAQSTPPTTPIEQGSPETVEPPNLAGGWAAARSGLGYALSQAGVVRGGRALLRVNQTEGFDCPSCAWPDPKERTTFEFCENGARAVADEATRARVTPEFFATWSVADLQRQTDHWLNQQGRLTHPMILRKGATHYEPIEWDRAFALLADELRALEHPNRAIFYTSGRTSNEAAFLYQLFVRQFGTNNLPDCSNMCHESSGTGLTEVLGIGKGTVLLEDFDLADAIFVIGQNPGTNHPRMLTALRQAKQRGCKIVAINPLREPGLVRFKHPQKLGDLFGHGVDLADVYLQVRIGGDIAALKGIMKIILAAERADPTTVFDRTFIAEHTSGFDELVADLDATPWSQICNQSGLSRADLGAAAAIAIEAKAMIACWAMGITQHVHGVANVQSIVNLLLLRGNIGRPGAGVCPVRGHSNVQGNRTVGIWEKPPSWIDAMERAFGFQAPREVGHDTVAAIMAMHRGEADVFFALGGNFVSASPDTEFTAAALRRCRWTAHVSTKLNRSHLVTGEQALILPCLGRSERDERAGKAQFVTVENSMGIVHSSQGTLEPASSQLLSEVGIVASLARATLGDRSTVVWDGFAVDYDAIRDTIAAIVPGFSDYNARVRRAGGFCLPNGPRVRQFATATGNARFTVHPIPDLRTDPDVLWMTTIRSHDQFNTTIYALNDRYRGVHGHRRVVLVNPADIAKRGLAAGQKVTLRSEFRGTLRSAPGFAIVPYDVPIGNVATYFPEANSLVAVDSYAERSRTPTSKAIAVTLHPE